MKVLLVDDDPCCLKILEKGFCSLGISPDLRSSPLEALISLQEIRYDILVTDFNMPEMSGVQVLLHFRRELNYPLFTACLTSAPFPLQTLLAMGFNYASKKPPSFADAKKILSAFEGRRDFSSHP